MVFVVKAAHIANEHAFVTCVDVWGAAMKAASIYSPGRTRPPPPPRSSPRRIPPKQVTKGLDVNQYARRATVLCQSSVQSIANPNASWMESLRLVTAGHTAAVGILGVGAAGAYPQTSMGEIGAL